MQKLKLLDSKSDAPQKASLVLSNGMTFQGESIGAPISAEGELVFNTGMVGYTQSLTDPSYYGQILAFTFPLMGNYGVPEPGPGAYGFEGRKISPSAVIVAHHSSQAFHWRSHQTLSQWLKVDGIPGVAGLDTRLLTQIIRSFPEVRAKLVIGTDAGSAAFHSSASPGPVLLPRVSTAERRVLGKGRKRIGLVDCGVKWNIIRQLLAQECEVELIPWDTDLSQVDCSAWLLSNGPGDPKNTGGLISQVRGLIDQGLPIFGICLGYQILALAAGAKTEKLRFGHRGHNHSVHLVGTQRGFMTSQNHGYAVVEDTLPDQWVPWFRHLNDGTLEGIRHRSLPFRGVQFHPEAAAGPQDTRWLMEEFVQELL